MVLNQEMRVTNMNRAQEGFLQRLGTWISWIDAIGMPISELSEQDADREWSGTTDQVLAQGETYVDSQRAYETSVGELVLSVEISPLKDGAGKTIGAIQVSEDVTEKVRLENELRQAEIVAERLGARPKDGDCRKPRGEQSADHYSGYRPDVDALREGPER